MRFRIRLTLVPVLLIVLAVAAALGPCLNLGFTNWDDDRLLTDNPVVRGATAAHVKAMFTYAFCGTYIPLTLLSFSIEHGWFALNPLPYHLTNILLHLGNALLAGLLAWRLSGRRPVALVTALFFAVHPLRVESVAWVTERKDVLFTAFYLAALIAYDAYLRRRSSLAYGLSVAGAVFSGLAKGAALTLPAALFLIDFYRRRPPRNRALLDKLPHIAVAAAVAAAAVLAQRTLVSHAVPLGPRLFLVAWVPVFYLFKTILPLGLSPLYPYPGGFPAQLPLSFVVAPLALILLAGLVIWTMRRTRVMAFGVLFFLAALIPVGQAITVAGPEIAANRYSYLPLFGIFYLIGAGADALARRGRALRVIVAAAVVVVISLLAWTSRGRCAVWRDSFSLWNDVLARHPGVPEAYNNRGLAFADRGDLPTAVRDYSRAIELKPDFGQAYNNRAVAYRRLGETARALEDFDRGLAAAPRDPELYYNRGNLWMDQGDDRRAVVDFSAALVLNRHYLPALNNRGNAYCRLEEYAAGIADYNRLLAEESGFHEARYNRAVAYFMTGDYDRAWGDVRLLRQAGYAVNPLFLGDLRRRSGRDW